ncbi:ABC transporter ATP-binding protein [Mangrovivirga sp. M17]|uniref:ABC transporter ATP-binding protein n=1 Tax=Mangrovivirga halotolerans TaxID=2993936 RepID=A0ABT3RLX3_9BACT|nr:ABC transporter ATP-binding protein [Mangrovivirga halotolerans]MCX2742820.1 ABC transporter ATP-binding protein [Mangrovivirga halotolerans]
MTTPRISCENISKKYLRQWIFRDLSYTFESGKSYAITGNNGSGKSTLIKILSGAILPTNGKISYLKEDGDSIHEDKVYEQIVYAAPYFDLIEEFTLLEALEFHFSFKPVVENINLKELPEKMLLDGAQNKAIKHFSSGMKQRLKLGLAFYSDVPVMFLDEPCSNLDETGINWYKNEILKIHNQRLIIVSSNQKFEYEFVDFVLNVMDYK